MNCHRDFECSDHIDAERFSAWVTEWWLTIQPTTRKEWPLTYKPLPEIGGKGWFTEPANCGKSEGNGKRIQPITHLASAKQICNLLNQFLCNLLSSVSAWFVCSLLGHVATVSSLGKPQKNSQFTKQIYLQFTVLFVQSVFFQFAEQFNHSLLDSVNQKKPNWFADNIPDWSIWKYLKFLQDVSLMVNYKFSFSKLQIHRKQTQKTCDDLIVVYWTQ